MKSPHLPNENVWTLRFVLNEYTPAEVERMTGLTTDSQRDWRRRGFLPRHEKHARFDIFKVAELYVMKMFVDQGKSPGLASAYASRVAASLVMTALVWREGVWGDTDPASIFDALPPGSRSRTRVESYYHQHSLSYAEAPSTETKVEWVADALLGSMGVYEAPYLKQAIWWPSGEVEIAGYRDENFRVRDGLLDRVDPRFDGAASVIHLEGAAANLARRSRLPFVSASLEINPDEVVNRPDYWGNHGRVIVETQRIKGGGNGS